MKDEIKLAFNELLISKFNFFYDNRVRTFKISRTKDGRWFVNSKRGFHFEGERIYINLDKFPNLRRILRHLEASDPFLSVDGGRVSLNYLNAKSKSVLI